MTTHTFTPGRWGVNGYNLTQVISVSDGPDAKGRHYVDGRHQVTVANVVCEDATWGERHANARLIGAAPAMLDALETLVRWAELHGLDTTEYGMDGSQRAEVPVIAIARSAITLATKE